MTAPTVPRWHWLHRWTPWRVEEGTVTTFLGALQVGVPRRATFMVRACVVCGKPQERRVVSR